MTEIKWKDKTTIRNMYTIRVHTSCRPTVVLMKLLETYVKKVIAFDFWSTFGLAAGMEWKSMFSLASTILYTIHVFQLTAMLLTFLSFKLINKMFTVFAIKIQGYISVRWFEISMAIDDLLLSETQTFSKNHVRYFNEAFLAHFSEQFLNKSKCLFLHYSFGIRSHC